MNTDGAIEVRNVKSLRKTVSNSVSPCFQPFLTKVGDNFRITGE